DGRVTAAPGAPQRNPSAAIGSGGGSSARTGVIAGASAAGVVVIVVVLVGLTIGPRLCRQCREDAYGGGMASTSERDLTGALLNDGAVRRVRDGLSADAVSLATAARQADSVENSSDEEKQQHAAATSLYYRPGLWRHRVLDYNAAAIADVKRRPA